MAIKIEFLASKVLPTESYAKIDFILENIKEDKIIVLEDKLTAREEKELIAETMRTVGDGFSGIEVSTLGATGEWWKETLIKMLGGKTNGLTVVGPSDLVKQVKKDPDKIRLLAGKMKKKK